MKKNLTFIALIAAALITSCGSSEKREDAAGALQNEKPKVKIEKVVTEEVEQLEEYATTVEAEVKNNIIPNSPLRIAKILVEVGDYVTKGQQLVELDASSLDQLKLQYENQLTNFKRIEELYKVGGTSKSDYDNMKMQLDVTKKNLDNRLENTILVSPIDGVISARNYDIGDMYGGQPILVVEQITPVKMKINISEQLYAKTNKDLDVTLKFNTYGEEEFKGNINIIYPTINAATHTFPVEIKVENSNKKIRPGMFGKAVVNFGTIEHVVVPDVAVKKQSGSGDFYVYTYENGKAKYNKVILGRRMDNRYELISGINPESAVIVAGIENLVDGIEVEVVK